MGEERGRSADASDRSERGGRSTRNHILVTTSRLTVDARSPDPSVADIARAAGVFPNQITYHFGSKQALLVDAAFLGLLYDAARVEQVGRRAPSAAVFRRNIARAILSMPALPVVARVLASESAKPQVGETIDGHMQLLFRHSERYVRELAAARGWVTERSLPVEIRTFWSTAIGAVLLARAGVSGTRADIDLAGTLTIHDRPDLEMAGTLRAPTPRTPPLSS
ncbi:TetR/AcrR family transcriptional regulator C-terminal domain-containing protein [Agromyces sp. MMS24-K17]|uniref:TetR/AcrR family transcriptional regulator C-terminal domain-containing protein n=1 Tax=Agromyces sp. MMS24-K17 TaxID=3372850 RepID=UPI0037540A97